MLMLKILIADMGCLGSGILKFCGNHSEYLPCILVSSGLMQIVVAGINLVKSCIGMLSKCVG